MGMSMVLSFMCQTGDLLSDVLFLSNTLKIICEEYNKKKKKQYRIHVHILYLKSYV